MRRLFALLLFASCRFTAAPVENVTMECERHCAVVHQRCVQNGEAAKLGLPGITLDLCRREFEHCQRDCRPLSPPVKLVDAPNEGPRDGVIWEPELKRLGCRASALHVKLTDDGAQAVTRAGADAVLINLAPDAVLLVRGGNKALPLVFDDWTMLHAQLTGERDANVDAHLNAASENGETVWTGAYESSAGRFTVRAREQSTCRWLTIERDGATRRIAPVSSW